MDKNSQEEYRQEINSQEEYRQEINSQEEYRQEINSQEEYQQEINSQEEYQQEINSQEEYQQEINSREEYQPAMGTQENLNSQFAPIAPPVYMYPGHPGNDLRQAERETREAEKREAEKREAEKWEAENQVTKAEKTNAKSGRGGRKIVLAMCLGMLFGCFGALGFWGVNKLTAYIDSKQGEGNVAVMSDDAADAAGGSVALGGMPSAGSTGIGSSGLNATGSGTPGAGMIGGGAAGGSSNAVGGISGGANTQSSAAVFTNTTPHTTIITGNSDVTSVAEAAMPSMVSIVKKYDYVDPTFAYFWGNYGQSSTYEAQASGSGFIIAETDSEYLIVSNNHVVEDPNSLEVTFVDGRTVSAYIKGTDKSMDVAVIAVLKSDLDSSTIDSIRIAAIGDGSQLKLGEPVVAIGNALGYGQSVTTGIVSALDREIETENGNKNCFIQTDAAINPGNSGGALLNMAGEVIGINSVKNGGNAVEGMGYALPINSVADIIAELMGHTTKIPVDAGEIGYIGINLQEVTAELSQKFSMPVGIYIVDVVDGGAAQAAGLVSGDIITYFDGEKIESYAELDRVLKYYAAGTEVTIRFERAKNGVYEEHTVSLMLGKKP